MAALSVAVGGAALKLRQAEQQRSTKVDIHCTLAAAVVVAVPHVQHKLEELGRRSGIAPAAAAAGRPLLKRMTG
jgi:hypothetical protein